MTTNKVHVQPFDLLLLLLCMGSGATSPCSVCPGGEKMQLPEKEISVPGYEFIEDCAALDFWVPTLLQDNQGECQIIRDVSTICGCPRKSDACNLCPDGSKVSKPNLVVPIIFKDQFDGITPTCELFEAYLHNVEEANSTCTLAQQVLSDYCGCSSNQDSSSGASCQLCPNGEKITSPNKTLDIDSFPLQNCQDLDNATKLFLEEGSETCTLLQSVGTFCGCPPAIENGCSLCHDRLTAANQSKLLPFLEKEFGFIPTCGLLEAVLTREPDGSESCARSQILGSYCGCAPIENHCYVCDPGDSITTPDKVIPLFERFTAFPTTCEVFYSAQFQIEQGTQLCDDGYSQRWRCGCNEGHNDYAGADTVAEQRILAWVPRITGSLSVLGSLYILWDIFSQRKKKLDKTYPQLMVAMSIFDLSNSFALLLSTLPIPQYDEYGDPTGIYGARGTQATCTAQGFFIQLGYTGMLYSSALSLYYVFVIALNWKESQLRKARKWMHGVPLVVGFSLAFAGIPFYENDNFFCYINPPPLALEWTEILVFALIPIASVITFTTVTMTIVHLKVCKATRASRKWKTGAVSEKKRNLERDVFHQCVFYLLSFYISWPILIVGNTIGDYRGFGFWVVMVMVTPLQGFSNCMVYLRPRFLRYLRSRQKKRREATDMIDISTSNRQSLNASVLGKMWVVGPVLHAIHDMRERGRLARQRESRRPEKVEADYVDPEIEIEIEISEDVVYEPDQAEVPLSIPICTSIVRSFMDDDLIPPNPDREPGEGMQALQEDNEMAALRWEKVRSSFSGVYVSGAGEAKMEESEASLKLEDLVGPF